MAEAEGIPPTASVASVGPGLRYIENWVYAFSGDIDDAASGSAATTMLDFTTGSGIIVGQIGFTEEAIAADNVFFKVIMNGETVINVAYDNSPTYTNVMYPISIPPFTHVEVKWGNSSNETGTAWLTGRVYGAA